MMPLSEALLKAYDFVVQDFFVLKLKVLGVSRLERPTNVRLNDARIVVVIIAVVVVVIVAVVVIVEIVVVVIHIVIIAVSIIVVFTF